MGIAIANATEPGRYSWGLLLVSLVIKKDEVLDNKARYALHGIILERPGIRYTARKEELGMANGGAACHLDVLESENPIRSVRDGGLKRFYASRTKAPRDQRMPPEEIRETIMAVLRERPNLSQMELVEEPSIDGDTVGNHLRELVKEGWLEDSKRGKNTVYRVR